MTRYDFKLWPEAVRAFVITAGTFIGSQIVLTDSGSGVESWEALLFSIGVGAFAAGFAAFVAALTRNSPEA